MQEVRLPYRSALATTLAVKHCNSCTRGVAVLLPTKSVRVCYPPLFKPQRVASTSTPEPSGYTTIRRFDSTRLVAASKYVTDTMALVSKVRSRAWSVPVLACVWKSDVGNVVCALYEIGWLRQAGGGADGHPLWRAAVGLTHRV